jgi:hypothetical protein
MLSLKPTAARGNGVFTDTLIGPDAVVLDFHGPLLTFAALPIGGHHDLQIGPDLYIGASHELDDYVNHSCDPNCWVEIRDLDSTVSARLIALRRIEPGEEITFDYSTTSTETFATWSMPCLCGASICRRVISGFGTLPKDVQARYVNLVPAYVLKGRT